MRDIQTASIMPEHVPEIIEIARECGLAPWSERDYIDDLKRPDSISFRILNGDKSVGFIIGRLVASTVKAGQLDAELYNVGVLKLHREKGLGSTLLFAFLDSCRRKIARSVFLEVRISNENAINFYQNSGFIIVSTRKDFYSDPTEDAYVMQLSLEAD